MVSSITGFKDHQGPYLSMVLPKELSHLQLLTTVPAGKPITVMKHTNTSICTCIHMDVCKHYHTVLVNGLQIEEKDTLSTPV